MSDDIKTSHVPERTFNGSSMNENNNNNNNLTKNNQVIEEDSHTTVESDFDKININDPIKERAQTLCQSDTEEDNNESYHSCSEEEAHDDGNGEWSEEEKTEAKEINEETLKEAESKLSEEDKQKRMQMAAEKKEEGNKAFKEGKWEEAVQCYSEALEASLISQHDMRSVLFSNQAAALIKLDKKQYALENLDKALKLDPAYMRARLRRADLNEQMDRLEESLEDYKTALEADPSLHVARAACVRLPEKIKVKTEKMKEEVFGKLKELGNVVLKPFGLSTDNFKVQQDPNTGSYSINMQK